LADRVLRPRRVGRVGAEPEKRGGSHQRPAQDLLRVRGRGAAIRPPPPAPAERGGWLTFVIVGAGATGVEMAGAIAEIARQTLKHDFRAIHPEEAQIILMDGGPRVLAAFPEELSDKAMRTLTRLGVDVRTGVR